MCGVVAFLCILFCLSSFLLLALQDSSGSSRIFTVQVLCAHVFSHFSRVWLFATPWTVACQASLPMGLSRQEYWSGLPGDLFNPGVEPASPTFLALQAELYCWASREARSWPKINQFSKNPLFLLLENGIRNQDLGTKVFISNSVWFLLGCLSCHSKEICVYKSMYIDMPIYISIYNHLYLY